MSTMVISTINPLITDVYLRTQKENQYFERKGLGDKDIKPTKIAEELIGMLNADGGVLAFGIADNGVIQDIKILKDKLDIYRTLVFDFIHPACNVELEDMEIEGNLIFVYHVEQDLERIFSRKDNDNVYLRMLDTNRLLNRDQIKKTRI